MGQYLREGTQECYDFKPDDTDTKMYLDRDLMSGISLEEILEKAKEKWPEATMENIQITPEYIHTHAIYYDRYDPTDYTHYLLVEYAPKKEPA